ncbi:MAG TPA: hypothetical protein VNX87_29735 [Candidatus Sulfotelmatobacter sp.]|nr:hypothetical protein [Candidatus Sulfotelmatobacter sp.]
MKMIFKNPGYFRACMLALSVQALNPMQPRCVSKATVRVAEGS